MRTAIVVATALLAGCALLDQRKWYRPNTDESTFYQDRHQCEMQAASAFPAIMSQVQTSPGVRMPQQQETRTDCRPTGYGQVSCTTSPTGIDTSIYNRPPTYATVDANAKNRSGAAQSCLYAKGYVLR
jgi:hypothetical protein